MPTTATTNLQFRLAARPVGLPKPSDWQQVREPLRAIGDGELVVKALYLSLDPAMRGWMNEGKSYIRPVAIGETMRAAGVGVVTASNSPKFAVGDHVSGAIGVQEYWVGAADDKSAALFKIDPRLAPPTAWLNTLGLPGMTGYFGLLDVGQPKPGETVVVSGAAGAVGMVVGQVARHLGCRVVGIAGGRTSVPSWSRNSASTPASTTRTVRSGRASRHTARKASTFTSTTWAARSSTPCSPAST